MARLLRSPALGLGGHLVTVLEEKALGRADDEILEPDEVIPVELEEAEDLLPDELLDQVGDEDEVAAEA